jgi:hypothetical protein
MRQAEPGKGRSPLATSRLVHRPIRGGFPCLPFYRWLRRRAALPPAHLLSPSGTPRTAKLQGIPLGFRYPTTGACFVSIPAFGEVAFAAWRVRN